jgi:hypothetical protein
VEAGGNDASNIDSSASDKGILVIESLFGVAPFARRLTLVKLSMKTRKFNSWRAEHGATASYRHAFVPDRLGG